MTTIPASQIVSVLPNVLSPGGAAVVAQGVMLSNSTRVPIGTVYSFPNAAAVSSFFGPSSAEYGLASTYFLGFDGSTAKPGAILIAQYPTSAVAAYLRSASLASLGLAGVQALSGVLTLTVNGTQITSGTITLSTATSFSNAATIIQAAFTSPPFSVSYDSVLSAFVFTTTTTGATATITFATGTLSAGLLLTQATGAVTSQGAAVAVPATFMNAMTALTTNWVTFFTAFDPDSAGVVTNKLAFAAWANSQNNTYAYIAWDVNANGTLSNDTSSLGYQVKQNSYSGTVLIYVTSSGTASKAAFLSGAIASINFNATNGRTTMAFRTQSGLAADVTDATTAANLIANGYNFYGSYGTAATNFVFFYPGAISGPSAWIDSFVNHVWFNSNVQAQLMTLLTSVGSVPYNQPGYDLISAAELGPVAQAVTFGAIRAGVTLSTLQAAEVNAAAGVAIDTTLSQTGYYVQVKDPGAVVRAARGTPICNIWYMDGQSVQQITINSVEVA